MKYFFLVIFIIANVKGQEIDCGEFHGIKLPCWKNFLGVNESIESLPYYPYVKRPNGCSVFIKRPGTEDEFEVEGDKYNFKSACNTHDKCYYKLGSNPQKCNHAFLDNMIKNCDENGSNETRPTCYHRANLFYKAVQAAKVIAFNHAQNLEAKYLLKVKSMPTRNQLLKSILEKIPAPERASQIVDIVQKHIIAEENQDLDATMATLSREPIFESIPDGKTFYGHRSVADDYAIRYSGLTRKLHITNMTVDSKGAYAEMLWEGKQVGTYKNIKPVTNPKKFYLPMIVYYEVDDDGLIMRESVYYDQYLATLSLEIIPDIIHSKFRLIELNPRLIFRKG